MKELDEIMHSLDQAVEMYENRPLDDLIHLSEILKKVDINLYALEKHRIEAHRKFNEIYFTCNQTSNAAREKWAENQAPELYMIRRIMTAGYKLRDGIRSQIGIYRKEN